MPESIHEPILFDTPNTVEEESKGTMQQMVVEFIGAAAKVVSNFYGNSIDLQSFIDALALLDSVNESHETVAANFIWNLYSRNKFYTIQSKLLNIKQHGKNANT